MILFQMLMEWISFHAKGAPTYPSNFMRRSFNDRHHPYHERAVLQIHGLIEYAYERKDLDPSLWKEYKESSAVRALS
jgi:hypothetical protein